MTRSPFSRRIVRTVEAPQRVVSLVERHSSLRHVGTEGYFTSGRGVKSILKDGASGMTISFIVRRNKRSDYFDPKRGFGSD